MIENDEKGIGSVTVDWFGEKIAEGKVREIFDAGTRSGYGRLYIVTTDRISAFDCVLPSLIPGKGKVLNLLSAFWFEKLGNIVPNHLIEVYGGPYASREHRRQVRGRTMLVAKTEVLPIEAVVRGYLTGSAWKDYQKMGMVNGIQLPEGMQESEKFSEPLFTPSTKAEAGQHDEPLTHAEARELIGDKLFDRIWDLSIKLYIAAADYALTKGIIIADTKFEWGIDPFGNLTLIDEVLTPDSSRFWDLTNYKIGASQDSMDKQIVRDYVVNLGWDKKQETVPELAECVIAETAATYEDILLRLTGESSEEQIVRIEAKAH
jgi:phosphoribosylaminoimidazole-succinocarboxamide synthase